MGSEDDATLPAEPDVALDADAGQWPTEVSPVLRLALERPGSYHPMELALTDQSAVVVADLLYDGLTEAVGAEGRLRPGLAEAWWPNDDYRIWTFALDPSTGVSAAWVVSSLLPLTADAPEGNLVPAVSARLAAGIQSVSAPEENMVQIELERSNAGLPWIVSGLPYSVVGPAGAPTGAYRIASDDAAGLRLVPRLEATVGELPAGGDAPIRPVRVEWEPDRNVGSQRLVSGEVDGALLPPGPSAATDAAVAVAPSPSVSTRFYVLHLGSDRVAGPDTRALIHDAVDGPALAEPEAVLGQASDGLLPTTMAGYRPGPCLPCDVSTATAADPSSLAEAGVIEVAYSSPDRGAATSALVAQLAEAGIPARERRMEPEELASVIVSGGTDIFSFGWVAAATSSDAILPVLLSADSPANVARIGSTDIDRLLAAAAVTADDQARWDLHHQAHVAALSSGRLIPVAPVPTSLALAASAGPIVVRADGSIDLEVDG